MIFEKYSDATSSWDRYYYCQNANFNVMALTDSSGNVVERVQYDPYGKATVTVEQGQTATGNPYLFQGRRWDAAAGLYNFRNRFYSPELGRFVQRDAAGYVDGMNLYEFVGGCPVVAVDAMGLKACQKEGECSCKVIDMVITPHGIDPSQIENAQALGDSLDTFQTITGFLNVVEGFATGVVPEVLSEGAGTASTEWASSYFGTMKYPSVPARQVIDTILDMFEKSGPVGIWAKRSNKCCECKDGKLQEVENIDYFRCSRCRETITKMDYKEPYQAIRRTFWSDSTYGGDLFMPWERSGESNVFFSSWRNCIGDACANNPKANDQGDYVVNTKTGQEWPAVYDEQIGWWRPRH